MELYLNEFPAHIVLVTVYRLQGNVGLVNHPLYIALQLLLYVQTLPFLPAHPHQLWKLE